MNLRLDETDPGLSKWNVGRPRREEEEKENCYNAGKSDEMVERPDATLIKKEKPIIFRAYMGI